MEEWIDFARRLARESGELIMGYYGRQLEIERKSDRTPVTAADRGAEELMRGLIEARFPDHQIRGEEGGLSGPEGSPHQWLLDPIDGTNSFIRNVPLFGTLIALLEEGRPVLGVIHLPVTGDLLIGAEGRGTTFNGAPARVSETGELSEATVLMSCPATLQQLGYGKALSKLAERAGLIRSWGDCYGHLMVAVGRAEIMLDPTLNPWDIAALIPCIRGAGGRLTDREGQEQKLGESAVSTNGILHDEVMGILMENREEQRD